MAGNAKDDPLLDRINIYNAYYNSYLHGGLPKENIAYCVVEDADVYRKMFFGDQSGRLPVHDIVDDLRRQKKPHTNGIYTLYLNYTPFTTGKKWTQHFIDHLKENEEDTFNLVVVGPYRLQRITCKIRGEHGCDAGDDYSDYSERAAANAEMLRKALAVCPERLTMRAFREKDWERLAELLNGEKILHYQHGKECKLNKDPEVVKVECYEKGRSPNKNSRKLEDALVDIDFRHIQEGITEEQAGDELLKLMP